MKFISHYIPALPAAVRDRRSVIILIVFVLGLFWGGYRWVAYTHIGNASMLRKVRGVALQHALKDMVYKQEFPVVISELKNAFPKEYPWMHEEIGHILGEYAYMRYGMKAFAMCDPFYDMGCYHGVIEAAARVSGYAPDLYTKLQQACENSMPSYRDCTHPMGHAATILASYDVVAALHRCDASYTDHNDAFECWDGATMEYNSGLHSASLSANLNDPNVNVNDPHFPCNTYPAKYEGACVRQRLNFLAQQWQFNFPRMFQYCVSYASPDTITSCADTIGELAAKKYFDNRLQSVTACGGAGNLHDACVLGIIRTYKAYQDETTVHKICPFLQSESARNDCLGSK